MTSDNITVHLSRNVCTAASDTMKREPAAHPFVQIALENSGTPVFGSNFGACADPKKLELFF